VSIEKRIYDSLHQKSEEALASAQMSSLIWYVQAVVY